MTLNRRDFLAASAALPGVLLADQPGPRFDFGQAAVIDALSADEDWKNPEPIFAAYKQSGVTAIHTSLSNRNLQVAMRDLAEWDTRITSHGTRLLKLLRGADVAEAKRSGRVAVLLGFQNATIVE